MTRYAAFHLDLDNVRQEQLGELELDDARMLHVLTAAGTPARGRLDEAVGDINGRAELIVKLPPEGDGSDKESHALRKEAVPRTASNFLDAIQDNLKRWHNMVLVEASSDAGAANKRQGTRRAKSTPA